MHRDAGFYCGRVIQWVWLLITWKAIVCHWMIVLGAFLAFICNSFSFIEGIYVPMVVEALCLFVYIMV